MIPDRMLPQVVTIVSPGSSIDTYGNPTVDYDTGATRRAVRARVAQKNRTENLDGRDTLISGWLLITNDLSIAGRDRLEWNGATFTVEGAPYVSYSPRGPHHLEANLRLTTG